MKIVNIQQAKTQLSRLVEEAQHGETIVIAKAGKPRVRLEPCAPERTQRKLGGAWEKKTWIATDFDQPSPEIERLFAGGGDVPRRATRRK